jgi:protein-disulfide isomerase
MGFLKIIKKVFLVIPSYLRGLVIFAIIVLLSFLVNKKIGRIDYWNTEIGKKQLEEIKKATKEENKENLQNSNLEERVEVDSTNNVVKGSVKENTKANKFPTFNKKKDKDAFNNLNEDIVFGPAEAPVTIIDYSSYICPHCIDFYFDTMDNLMINYIKTSKVKYVKRMIIQKNTMLGIMLPYCINNSNNRYSLIKELYQKVNIWTRGNKKEDTLKEIALNNGFTEESFDSCIKNKELAQNLIDKQTKELNSQNIMFTPTIFINGQMVGGGMQYSELSDKINKVLNSEESKPAIQ